MSAFDDLTLGEVEEMSTVALKGASMADADPMMLAGAVMWMTARRDTPDVTWEQFKSQVKMSEIKAFSLKMKADEDMDPLSVQPLPLN